MRFGSSLFAFLAAPLLLSPAHALGDVHVVAPSAGPGVDFTSLQAAIDAAATGDVLLLKGGTYGAVPGPAFDPKGKGLTLVAETGATVVLSSRISSQTALPTLVLRGIDVQAPSHDAAVSLLGAAHIHLEDAAVRAEAIFGSNAAAAVILWSFSRLVAVNSTLTGSPGPGLTFTGGRGLTTDQESSAAIYGCQLVGGSFEAGKSSVGGTGGFFSSNFAFAAGTTITGGAGSPGKDSTGPGPSQGCTSGSPGGPGIVFFDFGSVTPKVLVLLGSTVAGGPGGAAGQGPPGCTAGAAGADAQLIGGTPPQAISGTLHGFATSTPVREGQTLALDFTGQPGELVFVDVGATPGFTYIPEFKGVEVIANPQVVYQGRILAGGTLHRDIPIGELGPGVEGRTVFLQSVFFSAAGGIYKGPPSAVVLLDAAF